MIDPDFSPGAIVNSAVNGANPKDVASRLAVHDGDIPEVRAKVVDFLRDVANALQDHRWST